MKIGVLALQGDFAEHKAMLERLSVKVQEVRRKEDVTDLDGLIIPGGESTVIGMLMEKYELHKAIREAHKKGLTIYGTCAGAILLAGSVDSKYTLDLIDVSMKRNGYGRQIDSFAATVTLELSGKKQELQGFFIRAPVIEKAGKKTKVLGTFHGNPIMVEQERILITTFHPELTDNNIVHTYFLEMIKRRDAKPTLIQ